MTHDEIVTRLAEIEVDLGERQGEYEQVAEEMHRLVREYELRMATAFIAASGETATERKHVALVALAAGEDRIYSRLKDAEGRHEGLKAAIRVLDQRAMIGMSLLKAMTREAGPQPAWSGT